MEESLEVTDEVGPLMQCNETLEWLIVEIQITTFNGLIVIELYDELGEMIRVPYSTSICFNTQEVGKYAGNMCTSQPHKLEL